MFNLTIRTCVRLFYLLLFMCTASTYGGQLLSPKPATPTLRQLPFVAQVNIYGLAAKEQGGVAKRQLLHSSQAFVVESSGFLLTSYRGLLIPKTRRLAADIAIALINEPGQSLSATIVSVEPTLNLAILKVTPESPLVPAVIAQRDTIKPGINIHVVEQGEKMSPMIASGKIKKLNTMDCYQESMSATMLEAVIKLEDGALGGPIVNDSGEVVAIHTITEERYDSTRSGSQTLTLLPEEESYRHVLPIFLAFNIYESIKYKKSFLSPWTGFSVRPLDDSEKRLFPFKRYLSGIGIDYVWESSPAHKLGIRQNDILTKFDYYPIASEADFQKWLYRYGVGESVKLHFIRNSNEALVVDYTIEERPAWAIPK